MSDQTGRDLAVIPKTEVLRNKTSQVSAIQRAESRVGPGTNRAISGR
jgi:hypothetical protein